jgi:hypothetical protein
MNYLCGDLSELSKMQGFERTTIILAAMTQYPALKDQKTWNMYFDPVIGAYLKAVIELGYEPFDYPLNDNSTALYNKIRELTSLPGNIIMAYLKGLHKAVQEGRISVKWWNPLSARELDPYAPEVESFIDTLKNISINSLKVGTGAFEKLFSKMLIVTAVVGIAYVAAPAILKAVTTRKGTQVS